MSTQETQSNKDGPAETLRSGDLFGFARCENCKWWQLDEDSRYSRVIFPCDPATYEQEEDEEKNAAKWGHKVRQCKHPRLLFYQRPDRDAAAVCDGSEYRAELLTGPDFGCRLHEPNT